MSEVNVTELRQNLPDYLAEVRKGKELKVTVHGKVIARIVPEMGVKNCRPAAPRRAAREMQGRRRRQSDRRALDGGAWSFLTPTR